MRPSTALLRSRLATAVATGLLVVAAASAPAPADARRLVSAASNEAWYLALPERTGTGTRRHLEVPSPDDGPPLKLPITVLPGTRYVATMQNVAGLYADPVNPQVPRLGAERRLVLGVERRDDYDPTQIQRDKVQVAFVDKNRGHALHGNVVSGEPRYVAFDILFAPDFELSPLKSYVILFQGLQVGMSEDEHDGTGPPPFSIRVRGTTKRHPDRLAPINLMFERRWWDGGDGPVLQGTLPDDGLDALQRDRWYRIVLRLDPDYEAGRVTVWHWDLARAYDRCDGPRGDWQVPWGYYPPPSGDHREDALRGEIQYGLGIYRRASDARQTVSLKNIRIGTTYDDVVPGRAC